MAVKSSQGIVDFLISAVATGLLLLLIGCIFLQVPFFEPLYAILIMLILVALLGVILSFKGKIIGFGMLAGIIILVLIFSKFKIFAIP